MASSSHVFESVGEKGGNDDEMEVENDSFDVGEFSQNALSSVMMAIKKSNELPSSGDDYDYYSSFSGFRKIMKVESLKSICLMEKILEQQGSKVKLGKMDLEEMFDAIVEANDTILERVGTAIDEVNGLRKKEEQVVLTTVSTKLDINTSWNNKCSPKNVVYRLLAGRNILRPQLKFKEKTDNSHGPFVPILKEKPNAIRPLAIVLEPTEYGQMYSHPYHCELNHFAVGEVHLKRANLQKPQPVEETPFHMINSVDQLRELNSVLKTQNEFAVDLEHHSYRTFLGITCLLQISTRDADYIIDALELRSELQLLNDCFTDPKIVKVFHGADSDIEWLQRDFGLYVVNMFDTGQASRFLNFARFSLSFLLKHYCQIDANKQYQLADWRIRPLPEEMVRYAREDTHYLLFIYDNMKNELLDKGNQEENLLLSVFQRSKVICEKRYFKPIFHSESYVDLYRKSRKFFNTRQLYALKELYKWRDSMARAEDESTGYVLPNHMLLQISEVLPREQQGIFACCNPVPPFVRQNLNEIHLIVLKSREQSLIKPIEQDIQIEVDVRRHEVDLDNVLHCPHDFSHLKESYSGDNGPTIIDMWNKYGDDFENYLTCNAKKNAVKKSADLSALVTLDVTSPKKSQKKKCEDIESSFKSYCSPFQRYALVRPMLTKSEKGDSNGSSIKDAVDDVRNHFVQLAAVHGRSNGLEEKKSTSQGTEEQDASVPKELKKTKSKNVKRKRKLESNSTTTKTTIETKEESPVAEEEEEKEEPKSKKTKRGTKKKGKKGTRSKATTEDNETTGFNPFNYDGANFKEFKGGSHLAKKKKKQFNPSGKFTEKRRGTKKSRQNQPSQNKSLTYTVNAAEKLGNSSKVSWPKK